MDPKAQELAERIISGDETVAARVISMIEDGEEEGFLVLSTLYPRTGGAFKIGITGSPGAGKSSIIDRLAYLYGKSGKKIGIIAIDPTSVKSKGAFFGDRLRFKSAEKVEGVFIRSMAHRGFSGGISKAAFGAECVLDALGKDIIIVESVGVGQTELSIYLISDIVVTVFTPDFGDEIQLMKAGLLEIGDVVVMNKMDMPNAEEKAKDLIAYIGDLKKDAPPFIKCSAKKGEGIELLLEVLEEKRREKLGMRREKVKALLLTFIKEELSRGIEKMVEEDPKFNEILHSVQSGKIDPYSASVHFVSELLKDGKMEDYKWRRKG